MKQILLQVCNKIKLEDFKVSHLRNQGSYATKGQEWISFTDVTDVRERANWIESQELGGAAMFVLQFDDYNNFCECETFPLLKTINRAFGRSSHESERRNCSLFEPQAKLHTQEYNSSIQAR